jgi:hypothetical protein
MRITRKQARKVLESSFPDFRGRKIELVLTNKVTLRHLNADGGIQFDYCAVRWDGKSESLDVPAPWLHNLEYQDVNIPAGYAVVERRSIWNQNSIVIYYNPGIDSIDSGKLISGGLKNVY